jgi:integrase
MARSYRTGTMTEVRPGVWRLRVTAGTDPETGHAIQRSMTITFDRRKGTKSEAADALRAFYAEVRADKTVGKIATVGKLLTVHDIDVYLAALADRELAPGTIKLNHSVLRAALEQGVDWGWIKDNPAKRARLKSAGAKVAKPFTAEHLGRLYQGAIADEDIDMATMIALAAVTGCRRGELAGLRWDDLDVDRACLRVERQWVPGKGGQHLVENTKSGDGRTVFIGRDGVALLERYRAAKREQTRRAPDGWLLSYDGGTTPMRAKSMTEYLSRLAKRLNVPATVHTLRHWKQTELNRQGVDLPTAADQGGHSVGVMAGTYLHTSDDRGAAAGELVSAVVARALSKAGPDT